MAIFEVQSNALKPLEATTLASEGVRERDLQGVPRCEAAY